MPQRPRAKPSPEEQAEFNALVVLWTQYRRLQLTVEADPKYWAIRRDYSYALADFLRKCRSNGRLQSSEAIVNQENQNAISSQRL